MQCMHFTMILVGITGCTRHEGALDAVHAFYNDPGSITGCTPSMCAHTIMLGDSSG